MPEFCTCGAQLPPDALFCHKCGKPQREILPVEVVREEQENIPPPRATAPEPLPLNFRNSLAVRIALIVAAVSTVVFFLLPFLNWLFGGFLAVAWYRRRTGRGLNLGAGMRMGWITGVLAFVLYIIPFAIEIPTMTNAMLQRLHNMPGQDPALVQEMTRFFQSSTGTAALVTVALMFLFLVITFLSMAGGVLGAKVVGRS